MSKRKSDVWDFFNVENEESGVALCNLCKKNISRGGKSHTTSNLIKHLKLHHSSIFYKRKLKNSKVDESRSNLNVEVDISVNHPSEFCISSEDTLLQPSGSTSVVVSPTTPTLSNTSTTMWKSPQRSQSKAFQPTLKDLIKKKTKLRADDNKALVITQKITEMICLDNQPLSVVEDEGFQNLIHYLEPQYDIPKRKYFSTVAVPKLYAETKLKVENIIEAAKHVSITTDMWTSTANDDYLAITCHFIDNEYQWKHVCLEVVPFPEISLTGEAINAFLTKVLTEWKIIDKLHVVVRDNGKNIVTALNNSGHFREIPCLAHSLQLVVKDGLLVQRGIVVLSAICRKLVNHFKHSSKATKTLKAAQETLGMPKHKLIQDEPTRWNSTKHMMDRLLEQRRAIALAAPDLNLTSVPNSNDWELMGNVVKVMKIFDDATFQSSSSHTTILEVIPIVNSAIQELEKMMKLAGIKIFVTELLNSLKDRYENVEHLKEYTLATLLDPRLKGAVFLSPNNLKNAKEVLLEEADKLSTSNTNIISQLQPKVSNDKMTQNMWQRYSVLMSDTESTSIYYQLNMR